MKTTDEQNKRIAKEIVVAANPAELDALRVWAQTMLDIKASDQSIIQKAKAAILASSNKQALAPLLHVGWREMKRVGWTERGLPARMAIGAATAALTLSGQGAGIAALGGAVGVPLFIVFGAGGALAGVIIDEARKGKK